MSRPVPSPLELAARLNARLSAARRWQRIRRLRELGMHVGRDVNFPECLYVDEDYCWLISVGDSTSFGPECMILAHDSGPVVGLGAMRLGTVTLRPSCHIGARTIILPGVEIGPRTVVAANAVVSRSLPPDTVCAGRPARPFSTLTQYLEGHRRRIEDASMFAYGTHSLQFLTPERRAELVNAARAGDAYIIGGRSAELARTGGSERTPLEDYVPTPPMHVTTRSEQR